MGSKSALLEPELQRISVGGLEQTVAVKVWSRAGHGNICI